MLLHVQSANGLREFVGHPVKNSSDKRVMKEREKVEKEKLTKLCTSWRRIPIGGRVRCCRWERHCRRARYSGNPRPAGRRNFSRLAIPRSWPVNYEETAVTVQAVLFWIPWRENDFQSSLFFIPFSLSVSKLKKNHYGSIPICFKLEKNSLWIDPYFC